MPYYGYGMFYDSTYILVLIGAMICFAASAKVRSTYSKYSTVMTRSGITGDEIARRILNANELGGVEIRRVGGQLTDHFDPRNFTVNLSDAVYGSRSIAAVAVAAHECGHVLQHKNNYFPYNFRHALVPVANFGSSISWVLILAGVFLGNSIKGVTGNQLIDIGIICFSMAVLFQIVTLPVEFNASKRALRILTASNNFTDEELKAARAVLSAAALTYVAGAVSALLQMLRILILFRGNRRSD